MTRIGTQAGGGRASHRGGRALYAHVVDTLGREIIYGELKPGDIVFADQLGERLGVSRSVIREGVRTLGSMGLVEARPQVGTRVLEPEHWDLLNPYVVAWRNDSPDYANQMRELLELRLGVEYAAAGLAAQRIDDADAAALLELAHQMETSFHAGDTREFFVRDAQFHRALLVASKNVVIAQLAQTISATLDARGRDNRPGMHTLTTESVENHIKLAKALADRDADRAQQAALDLVHRTIDEFEAMG